MAKRTAVKSKPADGVNPRQPCPCGSGKRYKACHGAAGGAADVIVSRPFEGLAAEAELIALREFVPSATVKLPGPAWLQPDVLVPNRVVYPVSARQSAFVTPAAYRMPPSRWARNCGSAYDSSVCPPPVYHERPPS